MLYSLDNGSVSFIIVLLAAPFVPTVTIVVKKRKQMGESLGKKCEEM